MDTYVDPKVPLKANIRFMNFRSLHLALCSITASAALFVALVSPVSAAPSLDGGKALIRITDESATVRSADAGIRVLKISKNAAGSWFGERKLSSGKRALRAGGFSARELIGAWKKLGYGKSGVLATLTWDEQGQSQAALVRVRKPKVVRNTLHVPLGMAASVPQQLTNPAINLRRAADQSLRSFPVNASVKVSGYVSVKSSVTSAAASTESLINYSTPCISYYLKSSVPNVNMNYSCGGVNFSNGKWLFTVPTDTSSGSVRLTASISGGSTAPFTFDQIVVNWTESG